ncbi:MAG: hypothetical protein H0T75_10480 [Rhizobiales bacterium]|nr:hypothetical protein [Hyphomicrobiales bacterium]
MNASIENPPADAVSIGKAEQPGLPSLLFIFWGTFAAAVLATHFLNPGMFQKHDPDSLMRLVQVRDLLNGQAWFDLVQHRLDPPTGVLMHWSRLIDAPLAGLVLIGNLFGDGEGFALAAWPLLLLLGFMGSAMSVATALAGRAAAAPTLLLSLVFFNPLLMFLPGSIDHHTVQLALLLATLAAVLRMPAQPPFGLAAGLLCALSLAIGLEMLPYVAIFGAAVALRWAWSGEGAAGTIGFGIALGAGPLALHLLAGSPDAAMACDALSFAYAVPAAIAGCGLAVLACLCGRAGSTAPRLSGLVILAAASAGALLLIAPECLSGPYGSLSPELKQLWLSSVTEAQPLPVFVAHEPVGIIALTGPPVVALAIALRRAWANGGSHPAMWILPAVVIGLSLALSFYQVRTLPAANAVAIPVLSVWLAEIAARHGVTSLKPLRRAAPVIFAALLAMPLAHLAVGWVAVRALSLATGGRVAPIERADAPKQLVAGLSNAEKDCLDGATADLLSSQPAGLVLAPVFYGPSVLALSPHAVVGAPYHRGGEAILDSLRAMDRSPQDAQPIMQSRNVDYLAICATSRETALTLDETPNGLLSRLMSGESLPWLEPVPGGDRSTLRLWRVVD